MNLVDVLAQANPPEHLRKHLETVADAAAKICASLRSEFGIPIDVDAVLFGAATHDVGKVFFPEELHAPGKKHEAAGETWLIELGIDPGLARFARTHGLKPDDPSLELEDLLVMLADKLWKQRRVAELEDEIVRLVAAQSGTDAWQVFTVIDDVASSFSAKV